LKDPRNDLFFPRLLFSTLFFYSKNLKNILNTLINIFITSNNPKISSKTHNNLNKKYFLSLDLLSQGTVMPKNIPVKFLLLNKTC